MDDCLNHIHKFKNISDPIAIKPFTCTNETNHKRNINKEDYVTPGAVNFYRIHPQYLCRVSKAIVIKVSKITGNYYFIHNSVVGGKLL